MQHIWDKIDIKIKNAFEKAGYAEFTDIQKKVLPAALSNKDILASAKTGTGKTLAYVLPIVDRILAASAKASSSQERARALVLVPTKELAIQVDNVFKQITDEVGINTVNLIGGAVINLQRKILLKNPEIVVATPGRLMDHVKRGNVKMGDFRILVLDEADKLLAMGFYKQVKDIMEILPDKKQIMLFSATMPKIVLDLAQNFLNNPEEIDLDKAGEVVEEIEQLAYEASNAHKNLLLKKLIQENKGKMIVFVRTKENVSFVFKFLRTLGEKVVELHSSKFLKDRKDAMNGFRSDKYRILVATDIASRGLDIDDVKLVVNYDMPNKPEDYVHRIGRTGRIGKDGKAVTFVTPIQKEALKDIEELIGQTIKLEKNPGLKVFGEISKKKKKFQKRR